MDSVARLYSSYPMRRRQAPWVKEQYFHLKSDLGLFVRQQRAQPGKTHVDCIPNFWLLAYADFSGGIALKRFSKLISLHGPTAIFIPPFSVLNWQFFCEDFKWCSFQGTGSLPNALAREPVVFPGSFKPFESENQIVQEVLAHKPQWQVATGVQHLSGLAERLKKEIDKTFDQEISMAEIAEKLKCSHDVMTRAFKKAYEVTPSDYRRDLRYYQAALQITGSNKSFKNIADQLKINNYQHFSKAFRKVFHAKPRDFRLSK